MADISRIFALLKIIVFGITILLALIYSLLILLIPRFHHRLNILTINICVAMICSCTYWMNYFIMWEYDIQDLFTEITCTFLFYIQTICACQIPFSFTTLTINRFCLVLYSTKAFFKTKKFMIICIASQWIAACVLSLPYLLNIEPYCVVPRWMSIYFIIVVIIFPTFITLIINLRIFKHVHSSTRRIQVQNDVNSVNVTMGQQATKISRRDIHLLRHTIFMFAIFIIGWSPIFLLIAIDYNGNVIPLVYTILQILAVIGSFCCMLDLFLHNHELRRFIKDKLFPCF